MFLFVLFLIAETFFLNQNLLLTLPEETRIDEIRSLGEKVLPETAAEGQGNIRLQINNSLQEFDALRHSLQ